MNLDEQGWLRPMTFLSLGIWHDPSLLLLGSWLSSWTRPWLGSWTLQNHPGSWRETRVLQGLALPDAQEALTTPPPLPFTQPSHARQSSGSLQAEAEAATWQSFSMLLPTLQPPAGNCSCLPSTSQVQGDPVASLGSMTAAREEDKTQQPVCNQVT